MAPAPAPDTFPNEGTRVMFVGDSITGSPGCWRAPLWVTLTDAGHDVNMVGIRTENACGNVVNAAGDPWDPDNTGIGGITTTKMWVKLAQDEVLASTDPDVIVQLLGTNDLFGGATAEQVIAQYAKLVELYREYDPTISVVLGTPPPMSEETCGCNDVVAELASVLPTWAASVSTPEARVMVADLTTGFDPATDTYDGIHPSDSGTAKLAEAWAPVVSAALDARERAVQPEPAPSTMPTLDATPTDEAATASGTLATLGWAALGLAAITAVAVFLRARRRQT